MFRMPPHRFSLLTEGVRKNHEMAVFFPRVRNGSDLMNAQVMIMIHGNWATYRRWENYGRFFSDRGFLVIAPTLRHHYLGNSRDPALGKTSIRDYAKDVLELITLLHASAFSERLGFTLSTLGKPPVVIGHSMGGVVAQLIAEEIELRALILLCSAPVAGVSLYSDKDYKRQIRKFAREVLLGRPYLPDFEALSEYVYNGMPKEMHRELYGNAVFESGTSSREILAGSGNGIPRLIARLFSKPIEIDESRIDCPVLIVGCRKDRIIPSGIAKDLFTRFSARAPSVLTQYKLFQRFAHWPQAEPDWEYSAESIFTWIERLDN